MAKKPRPILTSAQSDARFVAAFGRKGADYKPLYEV